jgi:hypothetical protein
MGVQMWALIPCMLFVFVVVFAILLLGGGGEELPMCPWWGILELGVLGLGI